MSAAQRLAQVLLDHRVDLARPQAGLHQGRDVPVPLIPLPGPERAQPQLDLPETAPRSYQLDADPTVPLIENEAIRDTIVMLEVARDELINSQSARMPVGLLSFDSRRVSAVVDKVEAFLNSYIREVQPLDLPESSPSRPMEPRG